MQSGTTFLQEIAMHISENMHRSTYQVVDLCQEIQMNRTQLYRNLKKSNGKSFTQMLQEMRIQRACTLLKTHNYSVTEVAALVGFKDPSYFVKVFRKEVGTTPGKYMGAIKAKVPFEPIT